MFVMIIYFFFSMPSNLCIIISKAKIIDTKVTKIVKPNSKNMYVIFFNTKNVEKFTKATTNYYL